MLLEESTSAYDGLMQEQSVNNDTAINIRSEGSVVASNYELP
jgi:hypothetical protein